MRGYAPVPFRAGRDRRLSAPAHRLLIAIAFHDRGGANGQHCYASARTLSGEAGVHFKHIARYAAELEEWGYIEIHPNQEDRRRSVYRVIPDEVAALAERSDTMSPGGEEDITSPGDKPKPQHLVDIISSGDKTSENVTWPESQVVDSTGRAVSKKYTEGKLRNPAKPGGDTQSNCPLDCAGDRPLVRQDDRAGPKPAVQGELIMSINGGRSKRVQRPELSPAQTWATWLVDTRLYSDFGQAFDAINGEMDDIMTTNKVDFDTATRIFDKRMRERRRRFDQRKQQPERIAS